MPTILDSVLGANLAALPLATRDAIESANAGIVEIHSTGAEMWASIRTPDGRSVRMHSGRDPVTEADRFLDAALPAGAPPRTVFIIGAGLGYLLEAVERRAAATKIIAIEPFAAMARAMLERRDWREWMGSGRLTLLVGPHYFGASDAWKALDARGAAATILEHPVIARECAPDALRARTLAEHIVRGARSNDDARKKFAGRYLLNTLGNLPALLAEGDAASLRDLCRGLPAIVVAAGPSLDASIQQLQALQDRVLIVAVDTALRPLRAAGIRPHLVVAVDPSELNAKHLIGVADTAGSWLVGEGSIDGRVFSEFSGRAFSFKVSNHHPWPWLRSQGFDRGTLRAWGSVVTTAFDLACHAGCDPIVFVGADLAYTDGVHYCRGTIHEDAGNRLASVAARADAFAAWQRDHERTTCAETDIRGAATVSTPDFVQFRDWLVSRSAEVQPRRVLNATGAGILRGGAITQIDLAAMSFPPLSEGAADIHGRLRTAWRQPIERRDQVVEALERSIAHGNRGEIPLPAWLDFAGDTASSEQIIGSVEAAWTSVRLAWKSPPQVTAHPASVFWVPGWTARFAAAATSGLTATVQWQVSADAGSSWSEIADATRTAYEFTMTAADRGKRVRAVFRNPAGSATTDAAGVSLADSGIVADFDSDGKPDILWRDPVTGASVLWSMNGVTRTGATVLPGRETDLAWTVVGAGDFNGDGKLDLLWRNLTSGQCCLWCMDGVVCTGIVLLTDTESDPAWRVVGTGDFNGNGKPDILLRNARTGANVVWYMDGATRTGLGWLDADVDLAWTIVGTGDFNGDDKPDILWRNSATGANRVWHMDGVVRRSEDSLEAEPDPAWTVVGLGDFNGDGNPDILWRNLATGAHMVWFLDGVARAGVAILDATIEGTR